MINSEKTKEKVKVHPFPVQYSDWRAGSYLHQPLDSGLKEKYLKDRDNTILFGLELPRDVAKASVHIGMFS